MISIFVFNLIVLILRLENLLPDNFNWTGLHPVKRITALQTLLSEYVLCKEEQEDRYLNLARLAARSTSRVFS